MTCRPMILRMGALMPRLEEDLEDHFEVIDMPQLPAMAHRIVGIATSTRHPVPADLLPRLTALRVISSFGVGTDHLPLTAAEQRGILVCNTPGVLNDDTADFALALALALTRRVLTNHRHVVEGDWGRAKPPPLGVSLSGKTVGIAGLGAIGSIVARRFQAFGCRIAYSGRTRKADCSFDFHPSVEALAEVSDLLVVTLPGGPATEGLIGAAAFLALGPQGYFINIGRGGTVDEAALISALRDGTIAGAGLDVFADEPQVPDALKAMSNVVLQPHQASATVETRRRMADLVLRNLIEHCGEVTA